MKKVTDMAAAILAGGRNSRMSGHNKAFIHINGIAIIDRTERLLKEIFEEVIIVTNSLQHFKPYEKEAVIATDIIKDIGPLGGMHSALSTTSRESVFFVACDMPFLHNEIIRNQIDCFNRVNCDCLIPRIGNFIEPLHAIYRKSLKDKIQNFVRASTGYSVKSFLETTDAYFWDLENSALNRKIFRNLNTQQDLEEAGGMLCR